MAFARQARDPPLYFRFLRAGTRPVPAFPTPALHITESAFQQIKIGIGLWRIGRNPVMIKKQSA